MKPLAGTVLVSPDKAEERTSGGLFIPECAQSVHYKGTVAAVAYNITQVQVGDYVIFGEYAGSDIEIDGQTYVIIREKDIVCAIE